MVQRCESATAEHPLERPSELDRHSVVQDWVDSAVRVHHQPAEQQKPEIFEAPTSEWIVDNVSPVWEPENGEHADHNSQHLCYLEFKNKTNVFFLILSNITQMLSYRKKLHGKLVWSRQWLRLRVRPHAPIFDLYRWLPSYPGFWRSWWFANFSIQFMITPCLHKVLATSSPFDRLAQQLVPWSISIISLLTSSRHTRTCTLLLWISPKHLTPFATQPYLTNAVVSPCWIRCTIG